MAAASRSIQLAVPSIGPPAISLNLGLMESPVERPASALARGVQITEFKGSKINPDPVNVEDSEILLEEYLSPRKLRDLTGMDNLEEVHYLEMKVDTRDTSLGNFGCHLPSLSQLKLSNSIIQSVRDLGSSLHTLRVLWMARCGLEDLDGVSAMTSLQELYLAYNEICDISPCSMLEHLRVLDLEGNNIDEIAQIEYLALCSNLTNLTLEGNPVCVTPSVDEASPDYDYRQAVKKIVPQIEVLDDEPLILDTAEPRRMASVFEEDWRLIEEMLEDGTMDDSEESLETIGRPGSAIRPTTGYRPGSALKQQVATSSRPLSSLANRPSTSMRLGTARPGSGRPGSGFRPMSASRRPGTAANRPASADEDLGIADEASDLTRGGVVCGNPSKALRARMKQVPVNPVPELLAKHKHKVERSGCHLPDDTPQPVEPDEPDEHLQNLLSELKEWKKDYRQKQTEIDCSKAPQVLRIEHDASVDLSDSDSNVSSDSEDDISNQRRVMKEQQASPQPPPGTRAKNLSHPQRRLSREEPGVPLVNGRLAGSDHRSPSPMSSTSSRSGDERPSSNPTQGATGKFRLDRSRDKPGNKVIDKQHPVIRAALHTPEKLVPEGPRAETAQAALGQPPQLGKLRTRGLGNVPLLPSRKLPSVPK